MLTRLRKWRYIDPVVSKRGWEDILEQTLDTAERFHAKIANIPVGADRTGALRTMTVRDMVAHIIDMNFAIGTIIESLGQSKPVTYNVDAFYAGAGKRSWQLLHEHQTSRDWIEEAATNPVSSLKKRQHHLYGPLNSREWMGLAIRHYEYHERQLDRILASQQYKVAARLATEGKKPGA